MKKVLLIGLVTTLFGSFCVINSVYSQPYSSEQNELLAQVGLRTISMAIITYAEANNGQFPTNLLNDLVNVNPPYISQDYAKIEKDGYKYSVEFYPDGYKITATPAECGKTGNKIYILEARGEQARKIVQRQGAPADIEISESDCK